MLSPELQEDSIRRVCDRENLELIDVVEELDRSARQGKKRPIWDQTVGRVVDGEAEALVVWNLSRFSRSALDALTAEKRIEDAGGKLYSEEGATSKLDKGIRYLLAEEESDRIKAGFDNVITRTINNGVHFSSTVPVGYTRQPRQPLEVDPIAALAVVGLFERRVEGWNWSRLARWFNEQPGTKGTANRESARTIIQNTTYLGHAHHGDKVKRNAHPAIVSQKLWDAANAMVGTKRRGDGSLTANMLLLSLAKCGGCGSTLSVAGSKYKNHTTGELERTPGYVCKSLVCTEKAYIRASDLDEFVVRTMFRMGALTGQTHHKQMGTTDVAGAAKALDEATYDKQRFISNKELRRILSMEEYNVELEGLVEAVDEAQAALDRALSTASADAIISLEEAWADWTIDEKRSHLRKAIETLTVQSARRQKLHPAERTELVFRATSLIHDPGRAGIYRDGFKLQATLKSLDSRPPR